MQLHRHSSIKKELMLMILSVSMISIVATTMLISVIGYIKINRDIQSEAELALTIVGNRNEHLLEYSNIPNVRRKAFVNLGVFSADDATELACLYNAQNELVAFYDRSAAQYLDWANNTSMDDDAFDIAINAVMDRYKKTCPAGTELTEKTEFTHDFFKITRKIKNDNRLNDLFTTTTPASGAIYLKSNLNKIDSYLNSQIYAALAVAFVVLAICYLVALRMQRHISQPLLRLSDAAQNVTIYKDYSIRVPNVRGEDHTNEITTLVDSFNSMLSEIEDRDTKLLRKNVELEKAREAAEGANLAKSQFLANISHELRTPLNAIIGFSSIIMNQLFGQVGSERYMGYAKDIHDSGVHLLEVINDILDLSKAEAGKLSLKLEEFHVGKAIEKCINILSARAHDGQVTITTEIPIKLPYIVADRVRFIQIMINLISNAVKFTLPGGRVHVTVSAESANSGIHYFTIKVVDTGIGMGEGDIEKALQSFGQVDSGLNRRFEGTGLGLPLTKKLVELHNASMQIDSEVNIGTAVTLRFISDPSLLD